MMLVANPITNRIQAIKMRRDGPYWKLDKPLDFLVASDQWFRPVAITIGPDGCLYIVDWYNKIISHNEVPRNHPERDKTRGRIWRVRHESQPRRATVPNLYQAPDPDLLSRLRAASTWEVNAAWQEIVDRQALSLAPQLAQIVMSETEPNDLRIRALWCLEGLGKVERKQLETFAGANHRALRKEALRVARGKVGPASRLPTDWFLRLATRALDDPDRLVRQEAIRLLGRLLDDSRDQSARATVLAGLLANAAANASEGDWPRFPNFFRDFEHYLIRIELEKHPQLVTAWLDSGARGAGVPPTKAGESGAGVPPAQRGVSPAKVPVTSASPPARAFAALALGGAEGARRLALLMPELGRGPTAEELVLIASAPND